MVNNPVSKIKLTHVIFKTRLMKSQIVLSGRRLDLVCLFVLFVTLMYCGQLVGWIKMKLGMQLGLSSGHIVLDGDPAPPPQKGHSPPIFGPNLLWPNRWMD